MHIHLDSRMDSLIYILDEPTIGLHESEKTELLRAITGLKDLGNAVIVVELIQKAGADSTHAGCPTGAGLSLRLRLNSAPGRPGGLEFPRGEVRPMHRAVSHRQLQAPGVGRRQDQTRHHGFTVVHENFNR